MQLQATYIVDDNNQKIAAQIDIDTYNKIDEVLENYALKQFIDEGVNDEVLSINDAKNYYVALKKS